MTNPVSESPFLSPKGTASDVVRALHTTLSGHAVRSNQCMPKDGSETQTGMTLGFTTMPTLTGGVLSYDVGTTGVVIRLSSDALQTITGFANNDAGRVYHLTNVGTNDIVLINQSGIEAAALRMALPNNTGVTMQRGDSVTIWYDSVDSRWRTLAAH